MLYLEGKGEIEYRQLSGMRRQDEKRCRAIYWKKRGKRHGRIRSKKKEKIGSRRPQQGPVLSTILAGSVKESEEGPQLGENDWKGSPSWTKRP